MIKLTLEGVCELLGITMDDFKEDSLKYVMKMNEMKDKTIAELHSEYVPCVCSHACAVRIVSYVAHTPLTPHTQHAHAHAHTLQIRQESTRVL